jgi:exosortase
MDAPTPSNGPTVQPTQTSWLVPGFWFVTMVLLLVIFREAARSLYDVVSRSNSYYSHALLVPFVSLYFVWQDRANLSQLPKTPSVWGYPFLVFGCFLVLFGDLLGFRIFGQMAVIPLLIGLTLIFWGPRHLRRMWFPLVFLLFMIPLPESLTTSMTFRVRMLATEGAVRLSHLFYLPMIREGSYIHFGDDRILVGDVCGGLRSLIALLAMGTIMSNISHTKPWARVLILLISGPIAVAANIFRIFFLCVVAYIWGSAFVVGTVHDLSGLLIYIVGLGLMLVLEGVLRRFAPATESNETGAV